MRLDLLAEGCRFGWGELCIVFGRSDFFAQIEIEVPGAYDTVSASRVSGRDLAITIPPVSLPLYISLSLSFSLSHTRARATGMELLLTYRRDLLLSTANPLTPSLCPPAALARGRTGSSCDQSPVPSMTECPSATYRS